MTADRVTFREYGLSFHSAGRFLRDWERGRFTPSEPRNGRAKVILYAHWVSKQDYAKARADGFDELGNPPWAYFERPLEGPAGLTGSSSCLVLRSVATPLGRRLA